MAPRKKTPVQATDALSTFTQAMVPGGGAANYWRDGPFVGVAPGQAPWDWYYNRSWIARAAVERIPKDCFKRGYQWVAEDEQVTLLEAEERRLNVRKKKRQALEWSRRDGEAYLYFDTGQDPSEELNIEAVRRGGLRFVNALRRYEMTKGSFVTDPISPYHGLPEWYIIGTTRIHPSRVCRFVNGENPFTFEGISVLEYMFGPILAAETARDNTVALTTEALIDVMKVEGLMNAVQNPQEEAALVRRYELFRQMKATNRMGVIDKDCEDFTRHPSQFTTLPEVIESMRREVAAAIGIPYALLFGRPNGLGTNGDVELKNYYDEIATMQRNDIQPICASLDECIIRSALGSRPDEIYIDWLSLWEMSDKEKAEVAKLYADAAGVAVEKGIVPAELLTGSLINSWIEIGSFQGIEQVYNDWLNGGGTLDPPEGEEDVLRSESGSEDDTLMDRANAILDGKS